MRTFLLTTQLFPTVLSLLFLALPPAEALETKYTCDSPLWNGPAESNDGVFTGDLSLNCSIDHAPAPAFHLLSLRSKIIDKIKSESLVNQGPDSSAFFSNSPLHWDVSHHFEDEGNSIQIRELITLSNEGTDGLKYKTQSKEIIASGLAHYLKSVEFTMNVKQSGNRVDIYFRNKVQVKRPWYALDLIFAPIARNICLKKLNHVKDKFMPWLSTLTSSTHPI